ncbi:MAG: blaR1 4 [Phycisphaerales bacterium]|nr:blaR1 4 [Phycisphaerales bacterium]
MNGEAAWGLAETFGAWAWRASWQGAALAAVVALLLWAVGKRISPGWRFGLWGLVLLRLAMPAVVEVDLGRNEKRVATSEKGHAMAVPAQAKTGTPAASPNPSPEWKEGELAAALAEADMNIVPSVASTDSEPRAIATIMAVWQNSKRYVIGVWLTGMVLLGIRVGWSSIRLARAVRRMRVIVDPRVTQVLEACCQELSIRRPPLARELPIGGGAPALVGFRRPTVLLPAHLIAQMPDEQLRLILMHELAHVKRRDVLVNWLGTLVAVLHWPNPVSWCVLWRMRAERELACDELVLRRQDGSGAAYARTIVGLVEAMSSSASVASSASSGRVPAAAAAAAAQALPAGAVRILEGKAQIQRRLLMIAKFDATTGRRWPAVAATVALVVGALALSGATRAADPPTADPTTSATKPKVQKTTKAVESKPIGAPVAPAPGAAPGTPRANSGTVTYQLGAITLSPEPASPEDEKANARTAEKLRKPLDKIDFNEVPLRDVLDYIRDATGADLLVQWPALDEAGVARDVPITLRLHEPIAADGVLTMIFKSAALPLRYEIEKGVVVIGHSSARGAVITRVYDVTDLVASPPPPQPGAFGGSAGVGIGGEGPPPPAATEVDQLIKLIMSTASPETWREAGGDLGAIAFFKSKLVIKTTEPIHKEVANLLEMLREKPKPTTAERPK